MGINKGEQILTDQIITGDYQDLAGGLQIRFGASTPTGTNGNTEVLMTASATLHDVWEIECWAVGMEVDDSRSIKSINAVRA